MYIRQSTRAWLIAMCGLALMLALGAVLVYLPAAPSSAVGSVDSMVPRTTALVIDGTPVAQFPPPPGAPSLRPAQSAQPTVTSIVTLTDTLRERQPYQTPRSPSLERELHLPAATIAALNPELSQHRAYAPGETPLVGTTAASEALARRYLGALNTLRSRQGLPALTWDADLAARAGGHATTRLWYYLLDGDHSVSGPRAAQLDAYFGVGAMPRYAPMGLSSHGLPTSLLVGASDEAAILATLTDAAGASLYGAGSLPVTRVGIGIALAQNGAAPVPHGWLTVLFQ